jgi:hypothetical protein
MVGSASSRTLKPERSVSDSDGPEKGLEIRRSLRHVDHVAEQPSSLAVKFLQLGLFHRAQIGRRLRELHPGQQHRQRCVEARHLPSQSRTRAIPPPP